MRPEDTFFQIKNVILLKIPKKFRCFQDDTVAMI